MQRLSLGVAALIVKHRAEIALGIRNLHLPFGLLGIDRHQPVGQLLGRNSATKDRLTLGRTDQSSNSLHTVRLAAGLGGAAARF